MIDFDKQYTNMGIRMILKAIDNEGANWESSEGKEVKKVFFGLINYYAGKSALEEIEKMNAEKDIFEEYGEIDKKMNGTNKPKAKEYLKLFVKTFNTYFKVSDNYVDTSYHGSPEWEKTGAYDICFKSEFPTVIFDKLKKLYEINLAEDQKILEKLSREKKKQTRCASETL